MPDAPKIDAAEVSPVDAAPLRALLALAEQLANALDLNEIAHVVATTGVEALGASAGFVAVATEDETALAMHSHVRVDLEQSPPLCSLDGEADLPVIEAWRFGLPVFVGNATELYERYPTLDRSRAGREAIASLPLEVDGRRLGAINLTFATAQVFDTDQQAALRALAGLCAQALRRAQLTADLNRMRHDFIVTASHELRTPLASIYGAAVTMSGEFELTDDSRRELTRLIVAEAERLQAVIDDLRVTSDLDGDAPLLLDTQPVEVERALLDSIDYWQRRPASAPRLRIKVASDIPAIAADPRRLQQVLVNLVDNACKYGGINGTVTLTATSDDPGRVRIDIVDEGPGLNEQDRERAFEQFFRADPLNRSGIGGTGLGLYVARKLVHAMDGRIALEPLPSGEHGLRAVIELPAWRT
ncbi:MAG: hypothetical protein JWL76_464 [Thermoleophilia bacterium]|nr:hypothetical protein [Thermoleophilia bacterium]